MKQGDKVMVYQDPITQKKPEGVARLVYVEDENEGVYDGRLVQRWFVKFVGERQGYSRTILTDITQGKEKAEMPLTKEQNRERAQRRRAEGLCANCNDKALPGETRCEQHLRSGRLTKINLGKGDERTTHLKEVRLVELHPNPWQPRVAIDEEYIEELAADILSVGRLLQEPMARPRTVLSDEDDQGLVIKAGGFELAFGHSRIEALRLLHERGQWPAVVTIKVSDLTDEEMAYIALSENRARRDLTNLEVITAWSKALEIEGVTIQALADRAGIDRSTMSKNLAVLALPKSVLDRVADGTMKLRAAREFLCLVNDTHRHEDMIEAVMADCGFDNSSPYYADSRPDFRFKTIRQSILNLTVGRAYRNHYRQTGHEGMDKHWRPLFDGNHPKVSGSRSTSRTISFDLKAFEDEFFDYTHILPEGEESGGLPWTCQAKEWSKWSARATREATKAEAAAAASSPQNGKAKTLPGGATPKPKGSKWLRAVKADPYVKARLTPQELRRFKTADDLPPEVREALGTRVQQHETSWMGVLVLPAAAYPKGHKGRGVDQGGQNPPFFDFSECATCTTGAGWGKRYTGAEDVAYICTNKKAFMEKQSVGIEKFLFWRDELVTQHREEDLRFGLALAERLDVATAKIITMSHLDFAGTAERIAVWDPDSNEWRKYDVPAAGAEQFAAMVGEDLPPDDHYRRGIWERHLEEFFGTVPDDFDWCQAAAWLLVWKARVWAGLGVPLTVDNGSQNGAVAAATGGEGA